MDLVTNAVDEFFAWERNGSRLDILKAPADNTVQACKSNLLRALRKQDVFVLHRGDIEAYYPAGIEGRDKPTQAQAFCNTVKSRESALALCDDIEADDLGNKKSEFDVIFGGIFEKCD